MSILTDFCYQSSIEIILLKANSENLNDNSSSLLVLDLFIFLSLAAIYKYLPRIYP